MSKGTAETGDYNKYNYYNEGGERLYNDTYRVLITTTGGNGTYDQGGYTKVATIVYDRIKHSASVTVLAAALPILARLIRLRCRSDRKKSPSGLL